MSKGFVLTFLKREQSIAWQIHLKLLSIHIAEDELKLYWGVTSPDRVAKIETMKDKK